MKQQLQWGWWSQLPNWLV